jgi:hypothetical protein
MMSSDFTIKIHNKYRKRYILTERIVKDITDNMVIEDVLADIKLYILGGVRDYSWRNTLDDYIRIVYGIKEGDELHDVIVRSVKNRLNLE